MSERRQYPDSTGSIRDAASGGRRGEAAPGPVFYERTAPMEQPEHRPGDPRAAGPPLTATGPLPKPPAAPAEPPHRVEQAEPAAGDPELAAAAGLEPRREPPPGPHPPAPAPPHHSPARPIEEPPAQQPGMYEPTQLHAPVASPHAPLPPTDQRRAAYSDGDGVYRRNRPGVKIAVIVAVLGMIGLVATMLVLDLTSEHRGSPSALMSAAFALPGIPLAAYGLYPLLSASSRPDSEGPGAVLRPPYIFLIAGLALLAAAGMAA